MLRLAQSMDYPAEARNRGLRGEVTVKFIVLKSGEDINHTIIKSVHPILDKAAIQTIREASFEPGIKDGKPVNSFFSLPLKYRMKRF
ncbi:energy transducer TonB [Fodinibius salsisoli]|uniref:Energy transducer TonB n=1 Tax=Fodinibius salsisoli TaxID=2820877 RepID=A0ABT3PP68_9BACT|nr:energy transducer TonB [Fodinibius salsisoli]